MKHKILFSLLFMNQLLFSQSDLQNVIKGGELLLSGLSVLKISKSDAKKDSKVIESVCVKNKLNDRIIFRIVGKNEEGDNIKKNSLYQKMEKNAFSCYPKAFIHTKLYWLIKKFIKKASISLKTML